MKSEWSDSVTMREEMDILAELIREKDKFNKDQDIRIMYSMSRLLKFVPSDTKKGKKK